MKTTTSALLLLCLVGASLCSARKNSVTKSSDTNVSRIWTNFGTHMIRVKNLCELGDKYVPGDLEGTLHFRLAFDRPNDTFCEYDQRYGSKGRKGDWCYRYVAPLKHKSKGAGQGALAIPALGDRYYFSAGTFGKTSTDNFERTCNFWKKYCTLKCTCYKQDPKFSKLTWECE